MYIGPYRTYIYTLKCIGPVFCTSRFWSWWCISFWKKRLSVIWGRYFFPSKWRSVHRKHRTWANKKTRSGFFDNDHIDTKRKCPQKKWSNKWKQQTIIQTKQHFLYDVICCCLLLSIHGLFWNVGFVTGNPLSSGLSFGLETVKVLRGVLDLHIRSPRRFRSWIYGDFICCSLVYSMMLINLLIINILISKKSLVTWFKDASNNSHSTNSL